MAFQELIAKYKELIRKNGNTGELYKWQCIKHFQENFYIDTPDFHVMLKNALRERENLLYFISSSFILEASEQYPDETRQMFSSLYDEEVDLKKRIQNFQLSSDAILPKLKNVDDKSRHQQDERTVSFYLALRYPEKYPLYMYVIYNFMLQCFPDETKKRPGERFLHFNEIGHKLSDLIDKDTELQSLVMNTLDESCFKDRQAMVIFQDILWRCHQESEGIKLARICWNTKEWTSPSGSEGKSPSDDSHEGKYGFGNVF